MKFVSKKPKIWHRRGAILNSSQQPLGVLVTSLRPRDSVQSFRQTFQLLVWVIAACDPNMLQTLKMIAFCEGSEADNLLEKI